MRKNTSTLLLLAMVIQFLCPSCGEFVDDYTPPVKDPTQGPIPSTGCIQWDQSLYQIEEYVETFEVGLTNQGASTVSLSLTSPTSTLVVTNSNAVQLEASGTYYYTIQVNRDNLVTGTDLFELTLDYDGFSHKIPVQISTITFSDRPFNPDNYEVDLHNSEQFSITPLEQKSTASLYLKNSDQLVVVHDSSTLSFIRTETGEHSVLDLPKPASTMAVNRDETKLVLGHDGYFSIVDLASKTIEETIPVSINVGDILISANNWIYMISSVEGNTDFYSYSIEEKKLYPLDNRNYSYSTMIQFYNNETSIVSLSGYSPSDLHKLSISEGEAQYLYDSPYHGDYEMGRKLWHFYEEETILTEKGILFSSKSNKDEDLIYKSSLSSLPGSIVAIAEEKSSKLLYVACEKLKDSSYEVEGYSIVGYTGDYLTEKEQFVLPEIILKSEASTLTRFPVVQSIHFNQQKTAICIVATCNLKSSSGEMVPTNKWFVLQRTLD